MTGRYTVRSAYAGGYSESIRRRLERINLPEKVKCEVCKKFRLQSFFSKRQLENLRNAMAVQGERASLQGHAKCRDCVGGPNVELRCSICDQTKGLEDFAKNQRQNRDAARCLSCVQSHADTEPVVEETKHLLAIEGSAARMSASQVGADTYAGSTGNFSEKDGDADNDASSTGGGVWLEKENTKHMPDLKSTDDPFNTSGRQGNRRSAAPSEVSQSVHGGWGSWGVTAASLQAPFSNYNHSAQTPKRSNFARIPAARAERSEVSAIREPEPAAPIVQSDDEEDHNGPEDFL